MTTTHHRAALFIALVLSLAAVTPVLPSLQGDVTAERFTIRDVMIPMRDGVRLHTVVLTVTEPLIRSSQWMLGWFSTIQTICISD